MDMIQRHSTEQGLTLVETVIALVMLMIALLGVASVFIYVNRNNSGASDRAMALVIAQQQMEQLRNVPFTSTALNATSGTGTITTVTNANLPYTVVITITDTTPTRKTIQIKVTPDRPSSTWSQDPVILITQRSALTMGSYAG
jgi:Tfp pilus assembly protein PilV